MKRLLLVLSILIAIPSAASHIVGGEFELLHQPTASNPYRYRINLIYYFDVINNTFRDANGNRVAPEVLEPSIRIAIFSQATNVRKSFVTLYFDVKSRVSYTQAICARGDIVTDKLIYTTTITLSPNDYSDPEGYYLLWERCCRNYTILNIYSNDPNNGNTNPTQVAGQSFILKFPPVTRNGEQFINSSPKLFPPLSDYASIGKPYYADFAGIDVDGDSLVYSLAEPLDTHSNDSYPTILPNPPTVSWRPPFGASNMMNGNPELSISKDGLLTVTPRTYVGLYVFAVKVEEFRDGEKIGEVRRDFQMPVVEGNEADAPLITGRKLTDPTFSYRDNMSVSFSNTVSDQDRCIEVRVTDKDVFRQRDNFRENIGLKAVPLGFKRDVSGILPAIKNVVLTQTDSAKTFRICFDECPYFEGGPFLVGIIAYDDACALPLHDTLKILVNIQPPPNGNPYFTTPDVTETINEGDSISWPIRGVDDDGDALAVNVITDGFVLANAGMSVVVEKNQLGLYEARFVWDAKCNVYDFTQRTEFEVRFFLEDGDHCQFTHPDLMTLKLKIKLPGNSDPVISSADLTSDPAPRLITNVTRKVNETLTFDVLGVDTDIDSLTLFAAGTDFTLDAVNATFPTTKDKGSVQSTFTWNITCANVDLEVKDEFNFRFLVVDNKNKCRFYKADTLDVLVQVLPQDNLGPKLSAASLNAQVLNVDNSMNITLGEKIEINLTGVDSLLAQPDHLHLELWKAEGDVPPTGYTFAPADAIGTVSSAFVWEPGCEIFQKPDYENDYLFTFLVTDDRCFNKKADTVALKLTIKDVDGSDIGFLPPNFVSPNGDGKNDFFAMYKYDEVTKELISILPLDNCTDHFESVVIYNRWGKKLFGSTDREFRWYPNDEASGTYYYQLFYINKTYKGSISVTYSGELKSETQP